MGQIDLLTLIEDCVKQSTLGDFNRYLEDMKRRGQEKWLILSDYVLDDDTKPNNVFAFTVFPYFASIDDIKSDISTAAPRDIKNVKHVTDDMVSIMRSEWVFNWAYIFNKKCHLFGSNPTDEKQNLISSVDYMIATVEGWLSDTNNSQQSWRGFLKKLSLMKQELIKNSTNMKLMQGIFLTATIGGYLMYLVSKQLEPKTIGWFSDRDSIFFYCDSIVIDLLNSTRHFLCSRDGISQDSKVVVACPDAVGNNWYDDELRIPDYLAGTLADWDLSGNIVSKDKFRTVIENVLTDNRNLSILKFQLEAGHWQCGRIVVDKM